MNKYLLDNSNSSFTIKILYFKIVTIATKKNQEVKCSKPITENVNMNFIVQFISDILAKLIHHRIQLKYFRTVIPIIRKSFEHIQIDVDFSENFNNSGKV